VHTQGHFGEVQVRNRSDNLTPLLRGCIIRCDGRILFVLRERLPPSTGFRFSADTGGPTGCDVEALLEDRGFLESVERVLSSVFPVSALRFDRPRTLPVDAGCVLVDLHGLLVGGLRLVIFAISLPLCCACACAEPCVCEDRRARMGV
jgi:hypothetical protein